MSDIFFIEEEDLTSPEVLRFIHYHEKSHLYWTSDWSPSFYSRLAYEGLISTTYESEEGGVVLIPELQRRYAVLDWKNLHISGHIRKILRSEQSNTYQLCINRDLQKVLTEIKNYHDPSWLNSEYARIMTKLQEEDNPSPCKTISVELRGGGGELLAGEVGYTIGNIYTSLSGFCRRDSEHKNCGSLQLVLLAMLLRQKEFAFWNLGHSEMEYKHHLGAKVLEREDFLIRWKQFRDKECQSLRGNYSLYDLLP
ncbi:MAG: hypothetical protein B6241_03355 [Spirochaetaceae bacterium 4572_59]|nr:MAG: hypothetical protein B6241_03355 [Spirochaetaceae bacterium 4572_59]